MKRGSLMLRVVVASAVLVGVVAAALVLLLSTIGDLRAASRATHHSADVIAQANRYERFFAQAQIGARRFITSGEAGYLVPMLAARVALPKAQARVAELVADDPGQAARALELNALVDRYVQDLVLAPVELARTDPAQAQEVVTTGAARQRMDVIRERFATFVEVEEGLSAQREQQAESASNRAVVVGSAALGTLALLVLLYAIYLQRVVVSPIRRLSAASGSIAEGDLTTRVSPGGPGEVAELGNAFNVMAGALEHDHGRLEEQERTVRRTNETLETLIAASPLAIVAFELNGHVIRWNPAAERLFGWSADEVLGRFNPFVGNTEQREEFLDLVERAATGESWNDLEITRAHGDGTPVELSASTAPLRGEDGEVYGLVSIIADISERKRVEAMREEFVTLVSHELRTPLTAIIGYVDTMLVGDAGELEPQQQEFLAIVKRNAGRLHRLVNDLLFVSRARAGHVELDLGDVVLASIVNESMEAAEPAARRKDITLERTTEDAPRVHGDRMRLGQLLDNLLSNAIKFTEPGGRVAVRWGTEDGTAVLEVEDTGTGISDEDQAHLFEHFYRTAAANEQAIQGTGLGLGIAKMIVDAHGGSIDVQSTVGVGTTFRVELPLAGNGDSARSANGYILGEKATSSPPSSS